MIAERLNRRREDWERDNVAVAKYRQLKAAWQIGQDAAS